MDKNQRHNDLAIRFSDGEHIELRTGDVSITTEYFQDKSQKRTTLSPVELMFASFGL